MSAPTDSVALYASSLGHLIRPRTVIVEGTSDVEIFELASNLLMADSGIKLLDDEFTLVAAGRGDQGGVNGVVREFIALRAMGRTCLLANGRAKYRFMALLDNDHAGRMGAKLLRSVDSSVVEYRDVFRLQPVMPIPGMLDPGTVEAAFIRENAGAKGLDWELEDLIDEGLVQDFLCENHGVVRETRKVGNYVHREFTPDGKAKLLQHVKRNAMLADLGGVVEALRAVRYLAGASKK